MARQRYSFLAAMERVLGILRPINKRLSGLLLVGLFLMAVGIAPVRSQILVRDTTPHNSDTLPEQIDTLNNAGNYYSACEKLLQSINLDNQLCEGNEPVDEFFKQIKQAVEKRTKNQKVFILYKLSTTLSKIGLLDQSVKILEDLVQDSEIIQELTFSQKNEVTAKFYLSLGNTLRAQGNLERDRLSIPIYDYLPWQYVDRVKLIPEKYKDYYKRNPSQKYAYAINWYKKVNELSKNIEDRETRLTLNTMARVNYLSLLIETNQWDEVKKIFLENPNSPTKNSNNLYSILSDLSSLPNTRIKIYLQINLSKNLAYLLQQETISNAYSWDKITDQMSLTVKNSKQLKLENKYLESYARGNLGGLYEYLGYLSRQKNLKNLDRQPLLEEAKSQTEQALYLAQPSEAPDIAYQWQWQLGRLLEAQGKRENAASSYKAAIKTLESVRGNLISTSSDAQFSFRDDVEPLYRGSVNLLSLLALEDISKTNKSQSKNPQSILTDMLSLIDSLQLSELENFLKCNLSRSIYAEKAVNNIDKKAAFIYPIIFKDRLGIIFKFPDQSLDYRISSFKNEGVDFEKLIEDLQDNLTRRDGEEEVIAASTKLYRLIISPFEKELEDLREKDKLSTLVFVLDGSLRNIPMSVLYKDGKDAHYLVEKFATAVIPGRNLIDPRIRQDGLGVLAAGISQENLVDGESYSALPYVSDELQKIQEVTSLPSKPLLNDQFTVQDLKSQIKNFPIVHIATHGEFSANPNDTFILAWEKRIGVTALNKIFKATELNRDRRTELLVLSACKTAQGNRRATLGIAGIAARAKIRTVVATLWQVDDESTANLMGQFYGELKGEQSIAEALQKSQLSLLKNKDKQAPYFWAPFITVGNWK